MKALFLGLALLGANTALALTPDFTAYMRAATGTNNRGAAMECYSNKGAATGNEFRLGNECGIYGEFLFGANILKGEGAQSPFWRLNSNFAFVYANSSDFETAGPDNTTTVNGPTTRQVGNPTAWVLRELYTEGGNVQGVPFAVWAGKRFYRWGDIHMDDFFPVDMSGPGAGVGQIKSDLGTWSAALIQNSESSEFPGRTDSSNNTVTTTSGRAAKTTLHIRLEEMASSFGTWSVWLAGGVTPSTTPTSTSISGATDYKAASGGMLAIRNVSKIAGGENTLGVAYGNSVMSNMTARGELVIDCSDETKADCTMAKSNRIRAWDGYMWDGEKWSAQVALIYDDFNSGASRNSHIRWTSFGVRPTYWFTDNLSLVAEAGISNVVDQNENSGSRNLVRATIAPQISLGKGNLSRPVIRAFYTHNSWNDANKVNFAKTSAAGDTSANTVGVQTEVWF